MNQEIINKIKSLKDELTEDGFNIEGIFGSYSRDEQNDKSDIDILYSLDTIFLEQYRGFRAISRLDRIKDFLSERIGLEVDLADKNSLNEIGKKYILRETLYV